MASAIWLQTVILVCLFGVPSCVSQDINYGNVNTSGPVVVATAAPAVTMAPTVYQPGSCTVEPADPDFKDKVTELISSGAKLLEYHLVLENGTWESVNKDLKEGYRLDHWTRVTNRQGMTIIGLTFNYGVMSLTTLTFGVYQTEVKIREVPAGCLAQAPEQEKTRLLRDMLMANGPQTKASDFNRLCYQIISAEGDTAVFTDRCCRDNPRTGTVDCETHVKTIYARVLMAFLVIIRIMFLLFGALMIPKEIYSEKFETFRYIVKFGEAIRQKIYISKSAVRQDIKAKVTIDLKNMRGFSKCRKLISGLPLDTLIPVDVKEYDISVNYRKLLTENKVPVSLLHTIRRMICHCKLREVGEFQICCYKDMFGRKTGPGQKAKNPWIDFWRPIGKALLVFTLPIPYYIRLLFYYKSEAPEMASRREVAKSRGLYIEYDHRLVKYLSPLHPVWIILYIIYFITAFIIVSSKSKSRFGFRRHVGFVAFNSMNALHTVHRIQGLNLMMRVLLWPVERFGMFGLLIGLLYWLFVLPLVLIVFIIYVVPLFFLTVRIIVGPKQSFVNRVMERTSRQGVRARIGETMKLLESSETNEANTPDNEDNELPPIWEMKGKDLFLQIVARIMCLLSLWGTMVVLMVCAGFLVDICVYTLMGILANAGVLLRFVTLLILVLLYGNDIFKEVEKVYLKLNKALFSDIQGRVEELRDVTQMPSTLQVNRGFKSYELSEQADFEKRDQIITHEFREEKRRPHWFVNDLVLFVDSDDMPRIPRKLFREVCGIHVAGAPGPLYRSHLRAIREFSIIVFFLLFVFLIMLLLGESYGLSNTSATFATVISSFLPYILRYVLKPKPPDIELGSVSFKGKLDEKIKVFTQRWPLYDYSFEVVEPMIDSEGAGGGGDGIDGEENEANRGTRDSSPQHGPMHLLIAGATEDGIDPARDDDKETDTESRVVAEEAATQEAIVPVSADLMHAAPPDEGNTNNNAATDAINQTGADVPLTTTTEAVALDMENGMGSGTYDVDVLIIAPQDSPNAENWPPEWSQEGDQTELNVIRHDGPPGEPV